MRASLAEEENEMSWVLAISTLLGGASALAQFGRMLQKRFGDSPPAELVQALQALGQGATPEQIHAAIQPLLKGHGGRAGLSAGSDGGGNVHATGVNITGGDGPMKGGDVTVRAGDGGPHGKGGDLVITGGTIKGGDAK